MTRTSTSATLLFALCSLSTHAQHPAEQMITVDAGVRLQVLDFGGNGRPVVLLAGLGDDAHVYDKFAPLLTSKYHVYAITRRGFGESDKPVPLGENYSATRLGEDVLAVIDQLKLVRPVIAGHSIAGEELSALGNQHPERVAGLIYLDAGYPYALYNPALGDWNVDQHTVRLELDAFAAAVLPAEGDKALRALQQDLPRFIKEVDTREKELGGIPNMTPEQLAQFAPKRKSVAINRAVINSEERFSTIRVPVLAVFAEPHRFGKATTPEQEAKDVSDVEPQARLFEVLPGATVVRLPHADHYLFNSNSDDVLREMNRFLTTLK